MSSRGKLRKISPVFSNKGAQTALNKFLQTDCKSGKIDASQAGFFVNHMLSVSPPPPISSFGTLLGGLVMCKYSSLAISFYKTLDISGVLGSRSNPIILIILINCYSKMKLETVAFSVLGLMLKNGHNPDIIAFNSLLKGLFSEKKVVDAVGLYSKMRRLGCTLTIVTYNIMDDGLCKNGMVATALQLHRELVHGKDSMSHDKIDVGCIDRRFMPNTKQIGATICPNVISYSFLIDGLCRSGMEEDVKSLLAEMIDHDIHPNEVTYNILVNLLCKKAKMEQAMEI